MRNMINRSGRCNEMQELSKICRWTIVLVWVLNTGGVLAMTTTSPAPGNLFIAGEPVYFEVADVSGKATYELEDYFGEQVASGTLHPNTEGGTLKLPKLPPGYYELQCTDTNGTVTIPLAVVIDSGRGLLPADGRVGIDAALAWCNPSGTWKQLSHMVRVAGIPWVRERISWYGVEGAPGKLDWESNAGANYQMVADILHAEGLHISQVFESTPAWAYSGESMAPPQDLRTVYRALRSTSSHFAEQIDAWEVYNEPWGGQTGLADTYAGVLKAGFWGIRDGAPQALVLGGSLIHWVTPFARNLAECGAGDYFDVINVHRYHSPYGFKPVLDDHRKVWRRSDQTVQPVWITETNLLFWPSEGPDGHLLGHKEQHRAARYVAQAVPLALAADAQRIFFFILGHRVEGEVQFGFLRADLTPYPSFIALSAAANILGESEYLGKLATQVPCDARVFATPQGNVLVAWADKETKLQVPTERPSVVVTNLFGAKRHVRATDGQVTVAVGPEAMYLLGVGNRIKQHLRAARSRPVHRPVLNPSRVVVVGHCDLPRHRIRNWYVVGDNAPLQFQVDAYNFAQDAPAEGLVEVLPPPGWRVEGGSQRVQLAPMGRQSFTCQLWPDGKRLGPEKVIVHGHFPNTSVAPSVSYFGRDPAGLEPVSVKQLRLADPSQWQIEAPDNYELTTIRRSGSRGRLQVVVRTDQQNAVRIPLTTRFDQPLDLSPFDGLRFAFVPRMRPEAVSLELSLTDQTGASWHGGLTPSAQKYCDLLFEDLEWLWWSAPTASLDLHHIVELKLECNMPAAQSKLSIEMGDFQAVKYD